MSSSEQVQEVPNRTDMSQASLARGKPCQLSDQEIHTRRINVNPVVSIQVSLKLEHACRRLVAARPRRDALVPRRTWAAILNLSHVTHKATQNGIPPLQPGSFAIIWPTIVQCMFVLSKDGERPSAANEYMSIQRVCVTQGRKISFVPPSIIGVNTRAIMQIAQTSNGAAGGRLNFSFRPARNPATIVVGRHDPANTFSALHSNPIKLTVDL
ncbi:hypothetical protein ACJJTC_007119 [Scirpophaga incertulas]